VLLTSFIQAWDLHSQSTNSGRFSLKFHCSCLLWAMISLLSHYSAFLCLGSVHDQTDSAWQRFYIVRSTASLSRATYTWLVSSRAFFVTERAGVPGNENEECIFCMLSIILPAPFLKKKRKKVMVHSAKCLFCGKWLKKVIGKFWG